MLMFNYNSIYKYFVLFPNFKIPFCYSYFFFFLQYQYTYFIYFLLTCY